jgi:hypothetical protein
MKSKKPTSLLKIEIKTYKRTRRGNGQKDGIGAIEKKIQI